MGLILVDSVRHPRARTHRRRPVRLEWNDFRLHVGGGSSVRRSTTITK